MNRLADLFSRIDPNQYLAIVLLATAMLTGANLLWCAMRYDLGFGYASFLSGPDDRFADLVKLSLSFKTVTAGVENGEGFRSWPDLYKDYYMFNPYGGRESLAHGRLSHFHLPPFAVLPFIASAVVIVKTQSVSFVLYLFFALYLMTVQWTISVGISKQQRSRPLTLTVWFFALLSYPSLFAFIRGNYEAGITSLLIVAFMLSLFGCSRTELRALCSLAIAMNIRPSAALFLLAIPIVLGVKQSLRPLLCCVVIAASICAASYGLVRWIYPDYSVAGFFQGLDVYNRLYVTGPLGDGGNSSLFAFVKNANRVFMGADSSLLLIPFVIVLGVVACWTLRHGSRWIVALPVSLTTAYCMGVVSGRTRSTFALYVGLLAIAAGAISWGLWRGSTRRLVAPFFLTALYAMSFPVFADYHLLVFIAPMLLLYFSFPQWTQNYRVVAAIALGSVLVLSPKNYIGAGGISLQTLFNPLVVYFLTFYIVQQVVAESNAGLARCERVPYVTQDR